MACGTHNHVEPNRIYPDPPRVDYTPMIKVLGGHLGKMVCVENTNGTLVKYGCPKCSVLFAVDREDGGKPFIFHPGSVESVLVMQQESAIITNITLVEDI